MRQRGHQDQSGAVRVPAVAADDGKSAVTPRYGGRVAADQDDEATAPRAETQEERALRALRNVFAGADLTDETMTLANEFTDRQMGRLKGAWHRRGRSSDDGQA